MKVTPEIERESTAYHEAGHALSAYYFGLEPSTISIVENDGQLGSCVFSTDSLRGLPDVGSDLNLTSEIRLDFERRAITFLAGGSAGGGEPVRGARHRTARRGRAAETIQTSGRPHRGLQLFGRKILLGTAG